MSGGYEAFVFDFDGVLADSVEVKTEAFRQLYLPYGDEVAAEVVRYHRENGGMPRAEKFAYYQTRLLGVTPSEEDLAELAGRFSRLVVDAIISAPEIPGVTSFLEEWKGRVPMHVDSAAPDSELEVIVAGRGLTGYFESVYGSTRSKTDNLRTILEVGGYSPGKVLFFGDALSDYDASRKCGTAFMGIVTSSKSPLSKAGGTFSTCASFYEVSEKLRGKQ